MSVGRDSADERRPLSGDRLGLQRLLRALRPSDRVTVGSSTAAAAAVVANVSSAGSTRARSVRGLGEAWGPRRLALRTCSRRWRRQHTLSPCSLRRLVVWYGLLSASASSATAACAQMPAGTRNAESCRARCSVRPALRHTHTRGVATSKRRGVLRGARSCPESLQSDVDTHRRSREAVLALTGDENNTGQRHSVQQRGVRAPRRPRAAHGRRAAVPACVRAPERRDLPAGDEAVHR